jgi:Fe-S-cluster containining protein
MQVSREHIHSAATAAYERAARLAMDASPARCADACRALAAAIDEQVREAAADGFPPACEAGCAYCCHLRVGVFRHEAVALLHRLSTMPPAQAAAVRERARSNAARIAAMSVEEHYAARLPCAFLLDGHCSAHDVRPSACAAYHSMSRERCERTYRDPSGIGTSAKTRPVLASLQTFCSALIEATKAGLDAGQMPSEQVELHQAVVSLFADILEAEAGADES